MYSTSITVSTSPLPEFVSQYRHQEKFIAFCQNCHNYNTRWSCPPLHFDVAQFLTNFNHILIVGIKIIYDRNTIESANTLTKVKEITTHSLRIEKQKLSEQMLCMEKQLPGSVSLSSGGCSLCELCQRCNSLPCKYTDKMRHSLDSFGFDLSAITCDLLDIKLLWSKDRLPEYYTLIHALLTKDPVNLTADTFTTPNRI